MATLSGMVETAHLAGGAARIMGLSVSERPPIRWLVGVDFCLKLPVGVTRTTSLEGAGALAIFSTLLTGERSLRPIDGRISQPKVSLLVSLVVSAALLGFVGVVQRDTSLKERLVAW